MVPKELTKEQEQKESQFPKTFWRGEMTLWAVSSQVMKHGSTNTTETKRQSAQWKTANSVVPVEIQNNVADFFLY